MSANHPGRIIPQDTATDDSVADVITSLPISQDEIDELVYGEDRPAGERIERLRDLAADLRERTSGEMGDNDAATLLASVERAIGLLRSKVRFPGDPGMLQEDPRDHRETLSPDSDELEAIEEEDEDSIEADGLAEDDDEGEDDPGNYEDDEDDLDDIDDDTEEDNLDEDEDEDDD
ncbi:MAG TPA: hypothetical protein PK286_00375 [Devosia sp.]|nr:hypothetical protein [Devosia sp.]